MVAKVMTHQFDEAIKALAVAVSSQITTPKCVAELAKNPDYEDSLKRFKRGLERYTGIGYDIECHPSPIKQQTIYVLNQISDRSLSVIQIQKLCHLLTKSEKDSLHRYTSEILDVMSKRHEKALIIIDALKNSGVTLADLRKNGQA